MNSSRVVTVVGWSLLGLALALLYPPVIHAANLTVCLAGSPTCDYAVIQEAVDAASDGDVIKVASGEYTEINNHGSLAQVVYIDKSIIIRGGYTAPDFSEPPDPQANPTTLDAKEGGRALYITGSASPVVEGLRLTGGDANALGGGPFGRDAGGGVYISTATATLRDNQVLSNTAEWYGGGVYVHSSLDVTLSENEISHNTTHHGGGGGSGLYLSESNVTLSDNTISNNTATGSGIVYGGGLYLSYSTANLSSNTISGNTATWSLYDSYGGGVYVTGSDATFDGDTISGNHARSGGGLYLDESDTTVNDSTVLDNEAGDHGGGLYVFGGDVTVSHNTISGNHALKRGGGLYLSGSAGSLDENVFSENTASSDGGGMYVAYSNPTLTNNVIADNEANTASGVYLLASSPDLLHTTIAHNGSTVLTAGGSARSIPSALRTFEEPMSHTGGDGIGLYVKNWDTDYSEVNLTNTILAGHTVGIYVAGGNTATLEATLWASNDRDWDGAGAIFTGTVNVRGDPAFVNPGNGDYHISSGSAAIDEGVNAGVNIDIDGEPRPLDGGYDIGADELFLPPHLVVTKSTQADPVQSGAQLTYTLCVTNTGNVQLTTTVTDYLPAHVMPTGLLVWTPPSLLPDDVWTETFVVTVALGYVGPVTNIVRVASEEGATDAYTHTATVEETIAGLEATNDSPTNLGSATTLTASVTAGSHVTYAWAFGDGDTGSGAVVTHIYPAVGIHTAVVTASNPISELTVTTTVTTTQSYWRLYLPLVLHQSP